MRPFAAGREADVFALDGGRVLRRYRRGEDAAGEAEIMAYAAGLGFPVPEVYAADGPDLVMERLDGPTLAQALMAGMPSAGDPLRMFDTAVSIRSGQATLSAAEVAALGTAAAHVRSVR